MLSDRNGSYLQLGQVWADSRLEMFVKLRNLVAVTGSQSRDFTIFQALVTSRESTLEHNKNHENTYHIDQVMRS